MVMRSKTPKPFPSGKVIKANVTTIKASDVLFTGQLELVANEQDAAAEPTILLLANTGKPMDLAGFEYPVVVDLKGATFDKARTPIIVDHDTGKRFGHAVDRTIVSAGEARLLGGKSIKGPMIAAIGIRSSNMEIAKGIVADARNGFPFQVSIGARIKKGYILQEGDTAEVNGKTVSGPLIVASKSVIRELSITVLGADNETSAVVAAKHTKENDMDFEAWLKETFGLEASDLSEDQLKKFKAKHQADLQANDSVDDDPPEPVRKRKKTIKAKAKQKVKADARRKFLQDDPDDDDDDDDDDLDAGDDPIDDLNARFAVNTERIESINEIAASFKHLEAGDNGPVTFEISGRKLTLKQLKAKAIKEGWDADRFELHCRRADYPDMSSGFKPGIHVSDLNITSSQALEISILRACGVPEKAKNVKNDREYGLESMYPIKAMEESRKRQYQIGSSINRLLGIQVEAAGGHISHLTGHGDLMAAAFKAWSTIRANNFSGISVTNILENVMHKAAYAAFMSVESIWPFICARRPLNDFKVHSLYRLDPNGHFRKVATDGELKHVSMTDTKKTLQAETYGAMIAIDRKTQRNDDLGLVVDKARGIGSLGALRVEEAVFVLLLSNPSSFFASGNGNLISGGGSALSVAALQTAQQKFRDQIINGKPISLSPRVLLVGTNQEVLANQLYNQAQMWITTTADTPKFANNPFAGRFVPHYSGYLNNTSITNQDGLTISGQSATQWYLFADPNAPQGAALVIGFLDGRETPYFDEAATEFSIPGGIQMRSYFDFGVAMHITQLALKSAGA